MHGEKIIKEEEKEEKGRERLEIEIGARDALLGEGGLSRGHGITDWRHGSHGIKS